MMAIRAIVLIAFFVVSLRAQEEETENTENLGTENDSLTEEPNYGYSTHENEPPTTSTTTPEPTTTTPKETTTTTQQPIVPNERPPDYWYHLAKERFEHDCQMFPTMKNGKRAKNVILLLGDGMGMPTISAGRFYAAQQFGLNGSIKKHPFEEWPYNTMARTYDLETSVTDSASSATAYLTGTKTRTGMIGINGAVGVKQCGVWDKFYYSESVLEAAHNAGKATGVMTNTRITHASPSGCYGHVSYRDMESDADLKKFCPHNYQEMKCQDLACQLIQDHPYINVMIGGGQKNFYPNNVTLPADKKMKGVRLDGRSLVTEWEDLQKSKKQKYCLVSKPSDLALCDASKVDYLLGLPYPDHMPFNHMVDWGDPNLLGYVRKAIEVLSHQPNGYFLFIESGRIDHAHHNNEGRRSLDEMKHFDEIIAYIENTVNLEETLVIVTADHSHAFELVGQPGRFQSAIGLDQYYSNNTNDHMPLQGLNYMNGPNGLINESRKNPGVLDIYSWTYMQQALVPLPYASHGGDDVGVYAIGPMSPIFHVTVDNTMIAQAMKLKVICLIAMIGSAFIYAILLQVALAEVELPRVPLPYPPFTIKEEEISPKYWENLARKEFDRANRQFPDWFKAAKKAKNVILFLGDGMGIPTIAATRFDQNYNSGIPAKHAYEDWEFGTLCRTYDLETMVTDSASSATAYLTGTKTRTSMIGVTGAVLVKQCSFYTDSEKTESALTAAEKVGKWGGIVTTSRITHASPSGCFGHVAYRNWESDSDLPNKCAPNCGCTDLAYQLINEHPDIHVMMGGGQRNFYPEGVSLPSEPDKIGKRVDRVNLAELWVEKQKKLGRNYVYADSPKTFNETDFGKYDYALSLLSASHLPYELDKKPGNPSLYEMTLAAIKILKKSPNGFFLFVEGARIDQGHHENHAKKSFAEMHAFNRTIHAVFQDKDLTDTLLIVTADHSHSFELVGQQSRFRSLFSQDLIKGSMTMDHKGMLPIGYMTGPGAKMNETRENVTAMNDTYLNDKETQLQALIPINWSTHGGDDVAVYANGPFSYLFHSTVENTFIAQAMKYAMCAPPYENEPFCVACGLKASLFAMIGLVLWCLFN
ncbi:unnamed protein product [Hydatigera taeniaeformis]|uniref:Alkaline phosphatase n=1 Tax=Hydatigena taeniaeformis TaxID=6205 RepID=A0A0R3X1J7_HYDTA|nr:unnamed protein product [Hydatigera taeniaeformis]